MVATSIPELIYLFPKMNLVCMIKLHALSHLIQHMLNDEEATRAIRELNGAVLNGNRLNVEVCTCGYEL